MNSITARFGDLTFTDNTRAPAAAVTEAPEQIRSLCDYARLIHLQIIDPTATASQDLRFDPTPTQELQDSLAQFLTADRSSGYNMLTVIKATLTPLIGKCYAPIILGQDIKSILGWEYLSQKYLQMIHQRDDTLKLEDCLSPETLTLAKADCKKAAKNLTVRITLVPNVVNHSLILQSLHASLKLILKDSLSDLSTDEPSSFYYESTLNDIKQQIRFEFPLQRTSAHTTSADSMQLLLGHEYLHGQTRQPIVLDNTLGNQWCIDTMLKIARVYNPSNTLTENLFACLRSGYDPRGQILGCIRQELQTADAQNFTALWKKCSKQDSENKECAAQNALLLCQAFSKIPLSDIEQSSFAKEAAAFITQTLGRVDAKKDLWHACLALLQQELVSIEELESLLQFFGIAACTLQSKGNVDFMCSASLDIPTLSIQGKNKGSECVLQIPLNLPQALNTFTIVYERIKDHECTHILADTVFNNLSGPIKAAPTLKHILEAFTPLIQNTLLRTDSAPDAYLATTLLAAATGNTQLFAKALQGLVPAAISGTPDSHHTIGAALRIAFLAQGIEFPKEMQNGALQESNLTANWAAHLLGSHDTTCKSVGRELLAGLEGNATLKATWIHNSLQKDPELALRLIKQVENDPSIQESHVKQWLQRSPYNTQTLIWHYLVTSDTGRWRKFCSVTCPRYIQEAFAGADPQLCTTLQNAVFTEDTPKDEYRSLLLPHILDPNGIEENLQLAEKALLLFENLQTPICKKEREFLRANLKAFVAQAKKCLQPALAMRYIKVYQTLALGTLDTHDKSELLFFALETMPQDVAIWYLTLRGDVIPPKLEPARQCRAFIKVAQDHPSCIFEADSEYIKGLYTRIQSEQEKASLLVEIQKLAPTIKNLFNAFFVVKKEPKQAVQPAATNRPAPAKKTAATAESWIQKLKKLADELSLDRIAQEIGSLLKNRGTLSIEMNRQIWSTIFENPNWLNSVDTLPVFEQIDFFKTLFSNPSKTDIAAKKLQDHLARTLEILLNLIKANPKHVQKYLPYAHRWYELLPVTHKNKMLLGLSLLEFCTPADSIESIRSACAIVDALTPDIHKLFTQKIPAKKQQRKNPTQATELPLDGLIRFCLVAKAAHALETTHDTVRSLITCLGSQEAEPAHRFAIGAFSTHPAQDIREILWPSIKKMMSVYKQSNKNDPFVPQLYDAHIELLRSANIDLLLSMFETRFEGSSPKNQASDPEYTAAYNRLVAMSIDSQGPEDAKRALVVDCNIREFYGTQALAMQRDVKDYSTLRLRLLLKMIQHTPWSKQLQRLFSRFCNLPLECVDAARDCEPFYVSCSSPRFYSYDQSNIKLIGSICPVTKRIYTQELADIPEPQPAVHSLIYTGLRYACEKQTTPEQKRRLLDFTLQNIRNLMDHYPQVGFHSDCIKMFAKTIWPDEHHLWETHCNVVFTLLRCALHKKILAPDSEDVQDLLAHINRSVDELKQEDLSPLEGIRRALSTVRPENVALVLFEQQRALSIWQETQFVKSYEARQELLDLLFSVWKKHPEIWWNQSLIQSLVSLIAPNSLRIGQNNGPEGQKAANRALDAYLDFNLFMYNHTRQMHPDGAYTPVIGEIPGAVHYQFTKYGTLASKCLGVLVDEFAEATKLGTYESNYDEFIAQAKKLMPLFRSPSYLSVVSIATLAGKLTTTLLTPVINPIDEIRRVALVHEWLEHMRTHVKTNDFDAFADPVFQRIIRSDILTEFRQQEHLTLAGCLNNLGRRQLLTLQAETVKKSHEIPISTMECFIAIHQALQFEDGGKSAIVESAVKSTKKTDRTTITINPNGRIALLCLEYMTDALQKEGAAGTDNFSAFSKMLLQLVTKPSYLGIQASAPLLGRVIDILISHVKQNPQSPQRARLIFDWLQMVLSHKGDVGHIALLHHTMQSLIRANLISCFSEFGPAASQTLDSCLQDWQTSGIKISDELISSLILQQNQRDMLNGLEIAEQALDILLEKMELDD